MPIYQHKTARELSITEYRNIVEASRNKRLVQAIEFESARQRKNQATISKLSEKWTKLDERLANKAAAIDKALNDFDDYLNKLVEINNQLTIMEE